MNKDEMIEKLKSMLPEKRFRHSLNVMDSAVELAELYHEDAAAAALAGLLHDCAKAVEDKEALRQCDSCGISVDEICRETPKLLHGPLGAEYAKKHFDIRDDGILDAIRTHTTGSENMTLLQKIIFLADFIEPGRLFEGVDELRQLASEDIDKAVLRALDLTIIFVLRKGQRLHPETVRARNNMLAEVKKHI